MDFVIDQMRPADWKQVLEIYYYGMETENATLEMDEPDWKSWEDWDRDHLEECRLVVHKGESVLGWASLLPISARAGIPGSCRGKYLSA